MRTNILAFALALSLAFASLALAQQTQHPYGSAPASASQVKADAKGKKAKLKPYDPNDFGTLHDRAKKDGVDTSNPDSLKGRDVGAEIAKSIKL